MVRLMNSDLLGLPEYDALDISTEFSPRGPMPVFGERCILLCQQICRKMIEVCSGAEPE